MNIISYIKNNIKTVFFVSILLIVLYLISFSLPLTGDDFSYSVNRATGFPMGSLLDVLESVTYEYMHWMGRIACFFFAQLCFASNNQILFRVTYPLIIIAILMQTHYLITKQKLSDNNLSTFVIEVLMFYLIKVFICTVVLSILLFTDLF